MFISFELSAKTHLHIESNLLHQYVRLILSITNLGPFKANLD